MRNSATSVRRSERTGQGRTDRLAHPRPGVIPHAVQHVHLPGEVESAADSLDDAVALWVTDGRDGADGDGTAGQITLLTQSDLPHSVRPEDVRVTSVLMEPSLVAGLVIGLPGGPARLTGMRPVDPAAATLWRETVSYVKRIVLADDVVVTPLVVVSAGRLLAAVAQAAFALPDSVDKRSVDSWADQPVLLRRAVEFIDANVANEISLADIAEAIHVTPRAVQYMFRRHLDTTPLQYLRQSRLHYAHLELLAADRRRDTVTAVAARWGFTHTGRFAVLYRQTFGQSPHSTLRD